MNLLLDDFNPLAIAQNMGIELRQRRLFLNLTQKALAEKSGVSLGSLKRFESTGEISLTSLLKLALILDSLDEFHTLFPADKFKSIDEILKSRKTKERKRGRND